MRFKDEFPEQHRATAISSVIDSMVSLRKTLDKIGFEFAPTLIDSILPQLQEWSGVAEDNTILEREVRSLRDKIKQIEQDKKDIETARDAFLLSHAKIVRHAEKIIAEHQEKQNERTGRE